MEILDASNLMNRAANVGERARMAQLYPSGSSPDSLLAVDLLEVDPGGRTVMLEHAEEHLLFVVSGTGELRGAGGNIALVHPNTVVYLGPREAHQLRNTGSEKLRVLVSTPLLVRSERALGYPTTDDRRPTIGEGRTVADHGRTTKDEGPGTNATEEAPQVVDHPPAGAERAQRLGESAPAIVPPGRRPAAAAPKGEEEPLPDISSLMKRGSDIAAGPRPERRRPLAQPEPEPEEAEAEGEEGTQEEEEEGEEEHRDLMELLVVFDGGSRGNPGQGYGSYLVQSPGRKPVIKQVEFGDNYTNNQAEYESLIACLLYIDERLTATNRKPEQVALDIRTDSDLLVNQLQGTYKVKDAGLRQRHARAEELLGQFGEWMITWHPREESVRLLGH